MKYRLLKRLSQSINLIIQSETFIYQLICNLLKNFLQLLIYLFLPLIERDQMR